MVIVLNVLKTTKRLKVLEGFLPVCSFCKKIKDEKGSWDNIEEYLSDHSEVQISRRICDECKKEHFPELEEKKNGH